MKNDLVKGFTIFTLMVALAILTSVVSANAQSQTRVTADIPFEFVVGDQTMAAGEYTVKAVTLGGGAMAITGKDNEKAVIRLVDPIEPTSQRKPARLVFRRYGQSYFLAQVWTGDNVGRKLAKSKQEKAVERELASIPSKSGMAPSTYETIEVVAVFR